MGRTRRKRKRKEQQINSNCQLNTIKLQKSLKLKCKNLQISYFHNTGRGIKCKKKLKAGDVLISFPFSNLITSKVNCELFSELNIKNQSPQFILSIWLMNESHLGNQSKHFEYIESLPKYYTNLYFCSEFEINFLPDFIKKELVKQIENLKVILEKLNHILQEKLCPHCKKPLKDLFSQDYFLWAWFTVNTRSVYYKDEENINSLALAPFLDMFNHSNTAQSEIHIDLENKIYTLKTLVPYKKFEQVFIKYGSHSNLNLLLEYGFITPENPNDFVEFTFQEVINTVKEYNYKYYDISKSKYNFIKGNKLNINLTKSKEEFSWNLNGLIYILITNDQDLALLQSKTYSSNFNAGELYEIIKILNILKIKKSNELRKSLEKMEAIKNYSESFQIAKNLMRIYIEILQ